MLRIKRKFIFLIIYEIWFAYKFKILDIFKIKALLAIHGKRPSRLLVRKCSYTIVNSLILSDHEIFASYSATLRNEIRRAEKEGICCIYNHDVDNFIKFYNEFASYKGIPKTNHQKINELGNNLNFSFALMNEKILSAHSYLIDPNEKIVRLFQSASLRYDENYDRNVIGRANKLLHYQDMVYFKKLGYTIYDFGGYSENTSNKDRKGINDFKLSFGGNKVINQNYYSFSYLVIRWLALQFHFIGK